MDHQRQKYDEDHQRTPPLVSQSSVTLEQWRRKLLDPSVLYQCQATQMVDFWHTAHTSSTPPWTLVLHDVHDNDTASDATREHGIHDSEARKPTSSLPQLYPTSDYLLLRRIQNERLSSTACLTNQLDGEANEDIVDTASVALPKIQPPARYKGEVAASALQNAVWERALHNGASLMASSNTTEAAYPLLHSSTGSSGSESSSESDDSRRRKKRKRRRQRKRLDSPKEPGSAHNDESDTARRQRRRKRRRKERRSQKYRPSETTELGPSERLPAPSRLDDDDVTVDSLKQRRRRRRRSKDKDNCSDGDESDKKRKSKRRKRDRKQSRS